jgi:uncharacterized protein (TIGR03663 family)
VQEFIATLNSNFRTWIQSLLEAKPWRRVEVLIAFALLLIAIFTRFYDLETRVMSHDESEHTYFAWFYAENGSYQHTPITHGPLQFHLLAATYTIFGDTDATSRFPAAVAGVLAIGMLYFFRRWLKSSGALIAMAIMLVSPYFLFYSRYVRNEPLIVPVALLMFYSVLRYYETHESKWLYALTASLTIHFLIKETAFLYALELLIFLGFVLVWNLLRRPWKSNTHLTAFVLGLFAFIVGAMVLFLRIRAVTEGGVGEESGPTPLLVFSLIFALAGLASMAIAMGKSHGKELRTDFPSLDMMIVVATMMLPQLGAFPANLLGWDPLDYTTVSTMMRTTFVVVFITAITATVGIIWDWRRWQVIAAIFIFPYAIFYTSFFTNLVGFASGIVGSFGYWLAQQEVQRGGQPWYYYAAVQIPFYEYLAAIGALLAAAVGIRKLVQNYRQQKKVDNSVTEATPIKVDAILFFGYWTLISLLLFSYAGERMPWLTEHIVLPMILLSGWVFGKIVDRFVGQKYFQAWHFLIPVSITICLGAVAHALAELIGWARPLFGVQEGAFGFSFSFLVTITVAVFFGMIAWFLSRQVDDVRLVRWVPMAFIIGVFVLSARTAAMASYQNFDNATEFLVYAHSDSGVKEMIGKLDEFSQHLFGDSSMEVRFDSADQSGDSGVSWPLTWYLRENPNATSFGPEITRDLRASPALVVSDNNFGRVAPLLENHFQEYDYIRMVWPIQDYWNLTLDRISNVFNSAALQRALWEIWFNRDYSAYGTLFDRDLSPDNWQPSRRMRLYLRNDIVAEVTGEDVSLPDEGLPLVDPYQEGMIDLMPESQFGNTGSVQLLTPRAAALAADGSIYVVDSGNHRVLHFSSTGEYIDGWGEYANVEEETDSRGKFNEPWGIAVGPDGSVYVADTWNHRIQKFTADGVFLTEWGIFGTDESRRTFYGPRSIAIDASGRIFVSDTGNKRVLMFDDEGFPIGEIGLPGFSFGELDEPVGIGISSEGRLYVADTWNTRVQVFEEPEEGLFQYTHEWPIDGWYGRSIENKPTLAIGPQDQVCVTDPEGFRVLCFDDQGEFLFGWGSAGSGDSQFNIPISIVIGPAGGTWVVDSGNNRLVKYNPPW